MKQVQTRGGVTLETAPQQCDAFDHLLLALVAAGAILLALLAAAALAAQAERAWREWRGERAAAAEQTMECLAENIRLGIYGDELGVYCGPSTALRAGQLIRNGEVKTER